MKNILKGTINVTFVSAGQNYLQQFRFFQILNLKIQNFSKRYTKKQRCTHWNKFRFFFSIKIIPEVMPTNEMFYLELTIGKGAKEKITSNYLFIKLP